MGNVTARRYSPRRHEEGGVEPDAEFTDEVIALRLRLEHLHEFSGAGSSCYTTNGNTSVSSPVRGIEVITITEK